MKEPSRLDVLLIAGGKSVGLMKSSGALALGEMQTALSGVFNLCSK